MFRESIEAFDGWHERPADVVEIPVCQTGDYSTRINSFYKFEGECDLSFPLKKEWVEEAKDWLLENVREEPKVLLHIPMHTPDATDPRYCDPNIFCDIYNTFDAGFFDIQRAVEQKPYVKLDMPILNSSSDKAYILWGLAYLADMIITTDNHMLPLALALKKKTLYLPGNVPIDYLFDKRIDRSMVTIAADDPCGDFERML